MSLSDAFGLRLTPMPVAVPSRHFAPGKSIHVHVAG